MQWISDQDQKYQEQILTEDIKNFTLTIQTSSSLTDLKHPSENILKKQFLNNNFALVGDYPNGISFQTIWPTDNPAIDLSVWTELNRDSNVLKIQCQPLLNFLMIKCTPGQVNSITRFFAKLNCKLVYGSFSVNPETCEIYITIANQLSSSRVDEMIEKPYELIQAIKRDMKFLKRHWENLCPKLNHLTGFLCNFQLQSFLSTEQNQSNKRIASISQYVKQSHIEHPFMLNIRSKKLSTPEKDKKTAQFERAKQLRKHNCHNFTKEVKDIIEYKAGILLHPQVYEIELPQNKVNQIMKSLKRVESKNAIYSKLEIKEILTQKNLIKSGFSQICKLQITAKKAQDKDFTLNTIVAKKTQPLRAANQKSILKIIGNQKCIFIARYYFSQNLHNDSILMEYVSQGTLDTYLSAWRKFVSLETKLFFLYEISTGLTFLRDFSVVHNDLKPQNVLVRIVSDQKKKASFFILKLIDFGESYSPLLNKQQLNRYRRGFTVPYASPEQLRGYKFDQKTDVFGFGVMMYEMLFQNLPAQILKRGKQAYGELDFLKYYTLAPEKCGQYGVPAIMRIMYLLCLKCLSSVPNHRPCLDWICFILKELLDYLEAYN